MKFSTIASLCAAPLALATALDDRAVDVTVSTSGGAPGVDEVIVIWVNEGGGAATSTVTNTVTVTAASGVQVAAATHSVSLLIRVPSGAY
jgi:hypothetical protein